MPFFPTDRLPLALMGGSAGAPSIPSGGFYWLGSAALNGAGTPATSGQDVRNTLGNGQTTFDANLFRGGRGLFPRFVTPTRVTVTGNAAADVSGQIRAATVVSTGNDAYVSEQFNFPAGTFTIKFDIRSRTGADQQFRSRYVGKSDQTATATSTWQTISHTATITAGNIQVHPAASVDASSGLNVELANIRILPGTDGGTFTDLPNVAWGTNYYDTTSQPAKSSDAALITTGTGDIGVIEGLLIPCAAATFWSAFVLTSAPNFAGFIENGRTYASGSLWKDSSGSWRFDWGSAQARSAIDAVKNLSLNTGHVLIGTYDGTTARLFLDGIELASAVAAQGTINLRDLVLNRVNWIAGSGIAGRILGTGLSDRAWNASERQSLRNWAASQFAATAFPMEAGATYLAAEGDSITGATAATYFHKFLAGTSTPLLTRKFAVSGSTIADLNTRRAGLLASLPSPMGSRNAIVSVLIGANDALSYASAQAWCDALKAWGDPIRAAGAKLGVGTLLARTLANFTTRRNAINTILTGSGTTYADFLIPFHLSPTMGGDSAPSDLTYFDADGTHPNDAGQTELELVYDAAVQPRL